MHNVMSQRECAVVYNNLLNDPAFLLNNRLESEEAQLSNPRRRKHTYVELLQVQGDCITERCIAPQAHSADCNAWLTVHHIRPSFVVSDSGRWSGHREVSGINDPSS